LLFTTAVVAVWARRTALDTDRVVAAVDSATNDPVVIDALATRITDEVMKLIDNSGVVEAVLPSAVDRLAPVINAAISNAVDSQVTKLLSSDDGRNLLNQAVRVAHQTALRILRGNGLPDNSVFQISNGTVTLDVTRLIERVIELLQQKGVIGQNFDL